MKVVGSVRKELEFEDFSANVSIHFARNTDCQKIMIANSILFSKRRIN